MNPAPGGALEVLMAEDSPADVLLTRRAFAKGTMNVSLHVVKDGVEAIQFLRREGSYTAAPRIDVMLLDLNMPRMGGREVLANLKQDPQLKTLPVVILTTSDAERDIVDCYHLQANCYVTKPADFDEFQNVVRAIENFWFSVAKLPPV